VLNGQERRPPEESVLEPRYLGKSWYDLQIASWLDWFPAEQLLLIRSEDLRDHRAETMSRILAFLGVSTEWDHDVLRTEFHTVEAKLAQRQAPRRRRDRARRAFDPAPTLPWPAALEAEVVRRLRPDQERLATRSPDMAEAVRGWGIA
jgi:hypothetical protein